jgi:putative ATP-binding cassette transporter
MVLEIRWRRWLTDHMVTLWLADRAFYRLRFVGKTDNPDQRIAEDVGLMIGNGIDLATGFLNASLTVVAFAGVLWNLSGALTFSIAGLRFQVVGYMFWAALLYWAAGSVVGYMVGKPLIGLNNRQQKLEADFRFALVRIREKAEGIALYEGERRERSRTSDLFDLVYHNSLIMARRYSGLLAFQTFVGDGPSILPFLAVAPRYFSGSLPLGDLMKIGNGFGQISIALSWLVNSFPEYAAWHATVDRIAEFENDLRATTLKSGDSRVNQATPQSIVFDRVTISLPGGETLLSDLTFELKEGEAVLFRGLSGVGKTTLFRVLAGIWPFVSGTITLPETKRFLFLPQDAYLPIGSLRSALCFAQTAEPVSDDEILTTLDSLGLGHLSARLEEQTHWEQSLSAGERQRVSIAQAVLSKPDWLFLDESTSALDEDQEEKVYRLLRNSLPDTTTISIGHRKTLAAYHDLVISVLRPSPQPTSSMGIADPRR